jgi:hypothetical protein
LKNESYSIDCNGKKQGTGNSHPSEQSSLVGDPGREKGTGIEDRASLVQIKQENHMLSLRFLFVFALISWRAVADGCRLDFVFANPFGTRLYLTANDLQLGRNKTSWC